MTAAAMVASLVLAAPASAEVRSGSVSDPRDPGRNADVEQVRVSLDTVASQLEYSVRFYDGWSGSEGPRGGFSLGLGPTCAEPIVGLDGASFSADLPVGPVTETVGSGRSDREFTLRLRDSTFFGPYDLRCVSGIYAKGSDGEIDTVADIRLSAPKHAPSSIVSTSPNGNVAEQAASPQPGASQSVPSPDAQGVLGSVTRSRTRARVRFRSPRLDARVACQETARGLLRARWRGGKLRKAFRCRAGRTVTVTARVPARVARVRATVTVAGRRAQPA